MSHSPIISNVPGPEPSSLVFVDDLLRRRASEQPQSPVVAFPSAGDSQRAFRAYTALEIDRYVDIVATDFTNRGLGQVLGNVPPVVGLIGLSTFSYFVAMHALSRLGYAVFLLSTRLSIDAYISLLTKTNCGVLVYAAALTSIVSELSSSHVLSSHQMLSYDQIIEFKATDRALPLNDRSMSPPCTRVAFILHSSGSTGLPKPIYQTHSAIISGMEVGYGGRALNTCPLFHLHGLGMMHRTMYKLGTTYYPDFGTALTSSVLLSLLVMIKPSALFAVPYTLKLAAEMEQSLEILSKCEVVTAAGSACPDELGDLLTGNGVHLVSICGMSETGPVLTSNRGRGDPTWNYLRVTPSAKPYVWWKPVTEDTFEFVALNGMKTLVSTNSDDPPKSYHSRDLWTPHPSTPDAWKYVGRLDDRVTLANGEKVLPLPIEGRVRQDPLVKEAVVFGIGRDIPGLLLFRAALARDLSDKEFIDKTWPAVMDANSRADGFSQIGRDMIIPVSADNVYAQTDKFTIIRAKIYLDFAAVIERAYDGSALNAIAFEEDNSSGSLIDRLQVILSGLSLKRTTSQSVDPETDLFNAGLDSLHAIQFSRTIRQRLIPPSKRDHIRINQNVIYEHGNLKRLAVYLDRCLNSDAAQSDGIKGDAMDDVAGRMKKLIAKHSSFFQELASHQGPPPTSPSDVKSLTALSHFGPYNVVLTGSTGSLGSHILTSLISVPDVDKIYCILRPSSVANPYKHVIPAAHGDQKVIQSIFKKVRFMSANISAGPALGLKDQDLRELRKNLGLVIHCGWAVNFNIPLESFVPMLEGTANLLKLCKSCDWNTNGTQVQPRFVFISSISVALGPGGEAIEMVEETSGDVVDDQTCRNVRLIPEAPITDLGHAQKTGYGQSKLCAEHIIAAAAAAASGSKINAHILRIGQVVGDKQGCMWNPNESIPLMLRTASTIGALPTLDERCSWMPVDFVADAVLELVTRHTLGSEVGESKWLTHYYNIVNNATPFHWTNELLPVLKEAGLEFEGVPPAKWLNRLKDKLHRGSKEQETNNDPSMNLLDFWERRYGNTGKAEEAQQKGETRFCTRQAEEHSRTMKAGLPDLVKDGYIQRFVESWRDVWRQSVR